MKFRASIFPSIKSRGALDLERWLVIRFHFLPSSRVPVGEKSWLQVHLRLEVGPLSRGDLGQLFASSFRGFFPSGYLLSTQDKLLLPRTLTAPPGHPNCFCFSLRTKPTSPSLDYTAWLGAWSQTFPSWVSGASFLTSLGFSSILGG